MDFSWSPEQQRMREEVVKLAREGLNEGLAARDALGEFNRAGWKLCADFGIQGLPMPEEYGGLGANALTTVGVLERLGYACKDNGLIFSINAQLWTVEMPLLNFGTERQKTRWLPGLISGALIGGNAMTEPGSGSDAYSLSTRAERRGDRYVLNGTKAFISNGGAADVLLVYATEDRKKGPAGIGAFLVEATSPGCVVTRNVEKMGMRTSPMAEVSLEDCEVPCENQVGRPGQGVEVFTNSMTWERSCILASAVGSMERLLDLCIAHGRNRSQFGQTIGKFQLVASRVVDMKLRLETSRALLYRTAWLRDQGRSIFMESSMTKLFLSDSWVKSAEDALQVFGGYGYLKEQDVERELRDALGSRLFSGTSEVQRTLIAGLLGL